MNINTGNITGIFLHTSDVLATITIVTDTRAYIEYDIEDAPREIIDYINHTTADSVALESEQFNGYLYTYYIKQSTSKHITDEITNGGY